MKNTILLFFILSFLNTFSQRGVNSIGAEAPGGRLDVVSHWTRVDYARFMIPKDKNEIEGSQYAFDKWKNRGYLVVDGKGYKFSDINFNMRTNTIESQVGKDSIYIFDLSNVDHAFINNRKFKSYYFPKRQKNEIFELLFEGKDFNIIKGYEVGIKRPEVDPAMVRKPIAKYFTTERFYIKEGNNFKEIALKKKTILPLFRDKANHVSDYVKKNRLSYKKEKDVGKILNYYSGL